MKRTQENQNSFGTDKRIKLLSPIYTLPSEILYEIFLYLPNLFPLERVCLNWYNILHNSQQLWKSYFINLWGEPPSIPSCWRDAAQQKIVAQNVWKKQSSSHIQIIGRNTNPMPIIRELQISIPISFVRCFKDDNRDFLFTASNNFYVWELVEGKYPYLHRKMEHEIGEWEVHNTQIVNCVALFSQKNKSVQAVHLVKGTVVWKWNDTFISIDDFDGIHVLLGTKPSEIDCINIYTNEKLCTIRTDEHLFGSVLLQSLPETKRRGIIGLDTKYNILFWDINGTFLRKFECAPHMNPTINFMIESHGTSYENVMLMYAGPNKTMYYHYKTQRVGFINSRVNKITVWKDSCAYFDSNFNVEVLEFTTEDKLVIKLEGVLHVVYFDAKLIVFLNDRFIIYGIDMRELKYTKWYEECFQKEFVNCVDIFNTKFCFGTHNDMIVCKDFKYELYEKGDVVWSRVNHKSTTYWPSIIIDVRTIEKKKEQVEQYLIQKIGKKTKPYWVDHNSSNIKSWSEGLCFDYGSMSFEVINPPRGKVAGNAIKEAQNIIEKKRTKQ